MNATTLPARHWNVRELVLVGILAATAKISTLVVALAGGGLNPVTLMAKNLVFTSLLVIMLCKVRKTGTLTLFILVNVLVSMLLMGASITLLPSMLAGALLGELLMFVTGGVEKPWAPVIGAAAYDFLSKFSSVAVAWIVNRENPAMLYIMVPIVVLGYVGSLGGLFFGVKAVKELRHAGIVRS